MSRGGGWLEWEIKRVEESGRGRGRDVVAVS